MSDKMTHFGQDLNAVMTEVRDALHRWGLTGWHEYLVVRVPDKPESFVVLAHPSDKSDFADQLVRLHKDDASGDYRLVKIHEMDDDLLREFTAAMRAADESFEKSGGGTRHYLRDCLWPELRRRGLSVAKDGSLPAYLSEVFRIVEGATRADFDKVGRYAELLAEKLEADGEANAARWLRQILEGKAGARIVPRGSEGAAG